MTSLKTLLTLSFTFFLGTNSLLASHDEKLDTLIQDSKDLAKKGETLVRETRDAGKDVLSYAKDAGKDLKQDLKPVAKEASKKLKRLFK